MSIEIKSYKDTNYPDLAALYKTSEEFDFDEVTDSRDALKRKIDQDPNSILLAYENKELVGSVSIIEDGRIALLFRLVTQDNNKEVTKALVSYAENLLKEKGFQEVHTTGPVENTTSTELREISGFRRGNRYNWFWKKITG